MIQVCSIRCTGQVLLDVHFEIGDNNLQEAKPNLKVIEKVKGILKANFKFASSEMAIHNNDEIYGDQSKKDFEIFDVNSVVLNDLIGNIEDVRKRTSFVVLTVNFIFKMHLILIIDA